MNTKIQAQVREYAEMRGVTVAEATEALLQIGINRVGALRRHAKAVAEIPAFNVPYTTRADLAIEQSSGDEFDLEVA